MIGVIRTTTYVFLAITSLTALLVVAALGKLWFFSPSGQAGELPHLKYLLAALLAEIFAVVFTYARKGTKYLPHVERHKDEAATLEFMTKFISQGSTIQIVSNRLAWIKKTPAFVEVLKRTVASGGLVDIVTPHEVDADIRQPLQDAGVMFFVTREDVPPEARFTLINGNRSGAERLAIARGSHPDHEVTVFDSNSGPQMIGMAKDIIRKSKAMAHA
jgi:hypothetical protein